LEQRNNFVSTYFPDIQGTLFRAARMMLPDSDLLQTMAHSPGINSSYLYIGVILLPLRNLCR
jgi:hypothetical protein